MPSHPHLEAMLCASNPPCQQRSRAPSPWSPRWRFPVYSGATRSSGAAIMTSRILQLMLVAILATSPAGAAQQVKAQPPNALRLYVFDCGKLDIPDVTPYQLKK